MVKVGEVEFLVKFDTINTEFKKALSDVIKGTDTGVTDENVDNRVQQLDIGQEFLDIKSLIMDIDSYLDQITTPTHGAYPAFAAMHRRGAYEQQLDRYVDELISSMSKQTLGKQLGLTEEEIKTKEGDEIKREYAELIKNQILSLFDEALDPNRFRDMYSSIIAPVLGWLESGGSGTWKSDILRIMNKIFREFELKRQFINLLEKTDIEFIEPEKRRYFLKRDIGKEGKELIRAEPKLLDVLEAEFGAYPELLKLAQSTANIPENEKEKIKEKLRNILDNYRIQQGVATFGSLVKIFDEIQRKEIDKPDLGQIWSAEAGGFTRADIILQLTKETLPEFVEIKKKQGFFRTEEEEEDFKKRLEKLIGMKPFYTWYEEFFLLPTPQAILEHLKKGGLEKTFEAFRAGMTAYTRDIIKGVAGSPISSEEIKLLPKSDKMTMTLDILNKQIKDQINTLEKNKEVIKMLGEKNLIPNETFMKFLSDIVEALRFMGSVQGMSDEERKTNPVSRD